MREISLHLTIFTFLSSFPATDHFEFSTLLTLSPALHLARQKAKEERNSVNAIWRI